MLTYYHENYVKQAIESVLAQKTSFPFELVIVDDCSEDGTRKILSEYGQKYPNTIRVVLNEKNLGLSNNFFKAKCLCKGEYITSIAGDDYYIDESKLQKQADFLDQHSDFFAVAIVLEGRYDNDVSGFSRYPSKRYRGREFALMQFLKGVNFPLNGIMTRNALLTEKGREYFSVMPKISPYVDDLTDSILTLKYGKLFILDECTSVYRVRRSERGDKNFNSTNRGMLGFKRHIELLNNLYSFYKGGVDLKVRYEIVIAYGVIGAVLSGECKELFFVYRTVPSAYRAPWFCGAFVLSFPWICKAAINGIRKRLVGNLHG